MAHGLAPIAPNVDFVFSGEAETSFAQFLEELRRGAKPTSKIVESEPLPDLETLPFPDYEDYFRQVDSKLPADFRANCWISYESSRGCWWGKKHHCSFCGLNGNVMNFRMKPAAKVEAELARLVSRWGLNRICMTDNIMPVEYYRELLPRLHGWEKRPEIFYELKPTASFRNMDDLSKAGISMVQMGIETLSTPLLRLLNKGGSAARNVLALRNAQLCGIDVSWNFLYGIPGEEDCDYEGIAALIPAIVHLTPPQIATTISIDRFSPYFDRPTEFGIRNIRPNEYYSRIYPANADLTQIAYHFEGDYQSCNAPPTQSMNRVLSAIEEWRARWGGARRPCLTVLPLEDEEFLLVDTRRQDDPIFLSLGRAEVNVCVLGVDESDRARSFCIQHGLALDLDESLVPLVVTDRVTAARLEIDKATRPASSRAGLD